VTAYGLFMLPDQRGHDRPAEHPVVPESGQVNEAASVSQRLTRWVTGVRSWFHRRPGGALIWRGGVAVCGLVVIIIGIVLLPAPGPGWLVIFFGLGIWAMEFAWARSLLRVVRQTVGTWTAWLGRQRRWLTALVGAVGLITLGVVVAGAWLLAGS
jgi:uncharacterized protein (TIGR02611 family)